MDSITSLLARSDGGGSFGLPSEAVRRISIVCSVVHQFDAISECVLASLAATSVLGVRDTVETRVFCLESNVADSRIHVLPSARDLVASEFYQTSDVIVHHFGIFSELHSAIAFAPRSARVIVTFYGVTPPQFLP